MTRAPRPARTRGLVLAAALLTQPSCTKEGSAPGKAPGDDRLFEKLGEAARANTPRPHGAEDSLAELATTEGASESIRPLPPGNATIHLDTVAVKIAQLTTSHSVNGPKMALTSQDLFFKVRLLAQNVGPRKKFVDFGETLLATVESPEQRFFIARDAQRIAGTNPLGHEFAPAEFQERAQYELFFELPPAAVRAGLLLVFPPATAGNLELKIPLQ